MTTTTQDGPAEDLIKQLYPIALTICYAKSRQNVEDVETLTIAAHTVLYEWVKDLMAAPTPARRP